MRTSQVRAVRGGVRTLLVLLALAVGASAARAVETHELYEPRTHEGPGAKLPYRLFKPAEHDAKAAGHGTKPASGDASGGRFPLVLLLHGAGERGTDNIAQLTWGGQMLAADVQKEFPCFVVAPQCPPERQWVNTPWGEGSYSVEKVPESEELRAAVAIVRGLLKEFPSIDPARVYVMGLSMGGYGSWDAAARYPELFAAAVPICGAGDPSQARRFKENGVAAWAFHGERDTVVPPRGSREMAEALRQAGAEVRYTEFPGVDHGSWVPAWQEKGLFPWLFRQRKPEGHGAAGR